MSFSFPPNATSQTSFTTAGPILTVSDLKTRYLFGISLTDDKGNAMPDAVFQHAITTAISYLEHKLDIIILEREFTENYDYRATDYMNFNFLQLKKRPLSKLIEIKARFPNNQDLVKYPEEWYVVEKEAAQIQLSPVEGTFSGLIVTQGGSYVPLIYGAQSAWPHLFQVKYLAGFCNDQIPVIINEMIGMQAAIRIFEILGDLILGQGVTSESVGLDGASVSKQLGASPQFNAFSARIKSYKDQMKDYIESVKKYYNGIPSIVA